MPVVVHLKNGRNQEVRLASSCSWSSVPAGKSAKIPSPRWLVCRNDRGDVIATFHESDITGYKLTPRQEIPRSRFPKVWSRPAV